LSADAAGQARAWKGRIVEAERLCIPTGVPMSILTNRELEFLGSLTTSWSRLYRNELARLLREDDNPCDARHQAHSVAPAMQTLERLRSELGGQILAFAPEYRQGDHDLKCQDAPDPAPETVR
jgi:hypothetical protein